MAADGGAMDISFCCTAKKNKKKATFEVPKKLLQR